MIEGGLWIRLSVTCADINRFLNTCLRNGIILEDVQHKDDVTIQFKTHWSCYKSLSQIANNMSAEISVTGKLGFFWTFILLFKRPCLIVGVALLLFLNGWLPTRVLFVKVEGNQNLPTNLILEAAANCGIEFGTSRNHVRSEKVKNALLEAIPQLQWTGINTSGCVAVISVKERAEAVSQERGLEYGNIVAAMDGVIFDCTVEKGELVCKVGQAVQRGQMLVSGYRDNGLSITATKPKAEIYALTVRACQMIFPEISYKREDLIRTEVNYYLQIGEKYIKFNNSSGIYATTCVKIYEKNSLALPGGFHLPVSLVKQTCEYYALAYPESEGSSDNGWMQQSQQAYLLCNMSAGRVISYEYSGIQADGYYSLHGKYRCIEMIGQFKQEEIIQ